MVMISTMLPASALGIHERAIGIPDTAGARGVDVVSSSRHTLSERFQVGSTKVVDPGFVVLQPCRSTPAERSVQAIGRREHTVRPIMGKLHTLLRGSNEHCAVPHSRHAVQ